MNVKNEKLTYNNSFEFIRLVTVSQDVAKLLTQVIAFGNRFQCIAAATKKHVSSSKCLKLGTTILLLSAALDEHWETDLTKLKPIKSSIGSEWMILKVVKTLHKSTILLKSQMLEYTYSSLVKSTCNDWTIKLC